MISSGGVIINRIEEDLKIIEDFEEEIKFYINSDVRLEILIDLFSSPSTLKLLNQTTDLNYTSISTNVSKLEEKNIISKKKEFYYLKNQAKFKLLNILFLENNLEFLYEFEDFLNNHVVKNDDLELLSILPHVKHADLVQANNINPDVATELIEENMMTKGKVKSVCIYLHPNCSEMITYMMEHQSDFEVIVPLQLAEYILSNAMEYETNVPLKNKRFNIKPIIDKDLRIALVVSPDKVVLGLTWAVGKFNKNCVLVSHESEAIDWGYNLFNEYENLRTGYISIREIIRKKNNLP